MNVSVTCHMAKDRNSVTYKHSVTKGNKQDTYKKNTNKENRRTLKQFTSTPNDIKVK